MQSMKRFAIYYAPEAGAFADFAAHWLGWDAAQGVAMPQPHVPGLPRALACITAAPRKYGFHGTIKPPFHLADGTDADGLHAATAALGASLAPVTLPGLALRRMGGFVALTPEGDTTALAHLATAVLRRLDAFRAPPGTAEIARRNPDRLTPSQRENLAKWGYPYVMGDFQFHLTLTGEMPETEADTVLQILAPLVCPLIAKPFIIDSLCLFGEAADGRFHLMHRYALTG